MPSDQSQATDREILAGLVERVTFNNPETGFAVLGRNAMHLAHRMSRAFDASSRHGLSAMHYAIIDIDIEPADRSGKASAWRFGQNADGIKPRP